MQFIGAISVAYAKFPSELLEEMPLEDLLFLYRLYLIQPFGYRRDEFNVGLICSTVLNSQRATRDAKVWSPSDLMPLRRRIETEDDEDAINDHNRRVIAALVRRSGG